MCIFFSPSRIPFFPPFVKEISGNACNSPPQICHLTHKALSIRKRKIRTCFHRKTGSDFIALVPVTGLNHTIVWASSSRRPAAARRVAAFRWVGVLFCDIKKRYPGLGYLF